MERVRRRFENRGLSENICFDGCGKYWGVLCVFCGFDGINLENSLKDSKFSFVAEVVFFLEVGVREVSMSFLGEFYRR